MVPGTFVFLFFVFCSSGSGAYTKPSNSMESQQGSGVSFEDYVSQEPYESLSSTRYVFFYLFSAIPLDLFQLTQNFRLLWIAFLVYSWILLIIDQWPRDVPIPLFIFSIGGSKQNVKSFWTPVSVTVFYALSHGSLGFALHGSFLTIFLLVKFLH